MLFGRVTNCEVPRQLLRARCLRSLDGLLDVMRWHLMQDSKREAINTNALHLYIELTYFQLAQCNGDVAMPSMTLLKKSCTARRVNVVLGSLRSRSGVLDSFVHPEAISIVLTVTVDVLSMPGTAGCSSAAHWQGLPGAMKSSTSNRQEIETGSERNEKRGDAQTSASAYSKAFARGSRKI